MNKFELKIRQYAKDHLKPTLWDNYNLDDEVKFSKTMAAILTNRTAAQMMIGFLGGEVSFQHHEVDTEVMNIDVLIRTYNPNQEIIIENKIFSDESDNQIQKYVDRMGLMKQFVVFITPDGRSSKTFPGATAVRIVDFLEVVNVESDPILDSYRYAMAKLTSSSEKDQELLELYDEFPDVFNRVQSLVNERKSGSMVKISEHLKSLGFHIITATASRVQFRIDEDNPVNSLGSGSFGNDSSLARMELYLKNEKDVYLKYVVGPGHHRMDFIDYMLKDSKGRTAVRDKIGNSYSQVYSEFLGGIGHFENIMIDRAQNWHELMHYAGYWNP